MGFFSHKNRPVRATPSDLAQVPSKNVWLPSPVFLLYVVITQTDRDCLKHAICLAHYILIFPKFKKKGQWQTCHTLTLTGANRYYFNLCGREPQSSRGSHVDSQSQGQDGQLTPSRQSLTPRHPAGPSAEKLGASNSCRKEVIFADSVGPTA